MKDGHEPKANIRKVSAIYGAAPTHWVGNGFLVQSLLSYNDPRRNCDPFLLLDYAAPYQFTPNSGTPRGVGEHPHKGFETVTIAYQGEVAHRDSSGGGGIIREGDVQWMTAGSGIAHDEFHSEEYSKKGGMFEMVQLWVNLPARDKGTPPAYQAITKAQIPVVNLPDGAGSLRLIAGAYGGQKGTAKTFTEMNVWDMAITAEATVFLELPKTHNLVMVILDGEVFFDRDNHAGKGDLVKFDNSGDAVILKTTGQKAKILLLSGVPLNEPIAGYGPFVMNTQEEIRQAFQDYEQGKFGRIN